jgi:hypothetical protein
MNGRRVAAEIEGRSHGFPRFGAKRRRGIPIEINPVNHRVIYYLKTKSFEP